MDRRPEAGDGRQKKFGDKQRAVTAPVQATPSEYREVYSLPGKHGVGTLRQRMLRAQPGELQWSARHLRIAKERATQRAFTQSPEKGPVRCSRIQGHDGMRVDGWAAVAQQQDFAFLHAAAARQRHCRGFIGQANSALLTQTAHSKLAAARHQLQSQRPGVDQPIAHFAGRIDPVHVLEPASMCCRMNTHRAAPGPMPQKFRTSST